MSQLNLRLLTSNAILRLFFYGINTNKSWDLFFALCWFIKSQVTSSILGAYNKSDTFMSRSITGTGVAQEGLWVQHSLHGNSIHLLLYCTLIITFLTLEDLQATDSNHEARITALENEGGGSQNSMSINTSWRMSVRWHGPLPMSFAGCFLSIKTHWIVSPCLFQKPGSHVQKVPPEDWS